MFAKTKVEELQEVNKHRLIQNQTSFYDPLWWKLSLLYKTELKDEYLNFIKELEDVGKFGFESTDKILPLLETIEAKAKEENEKKKARDNLEEEKHEPAPELAVIANPHHVEEDQKSVLKNPGQNSERHVSFKAVQEFPAVKDNLPGKENTTPDMNSTKCSQRGVSAAKGNLSDKENATPCTNPVKLTKRTTKGIKKNNKKKNNNKNCLNKKYSLYPRWTR